MLRILEKNWQLASKIAPIFHKQTFDKSDLSSPMSEIEASHNLMPVKRDLLVSSFTVKNQAFLKHYVKFLVEVFDCEVSDIQTVYQFETR